MIILHPNRMLLIPKDCVPISHNLSPLGPPGLGGPHFYLFSREYVIIMMYAKKGRIL